MKVKTYDDIINDAIDKIREKRSYYERKQETLKADILDRYPEDMYGIRWMAMYDNKSRDLADQVYRAGLYLIALCEVKRYVEEEYERKKGKKTVSEADAECR